MTIHVTTHILFSEEIKTASNIYSGGPSDSCSSCDCLPITDQEECYRIQSEMQKQAQEDMLDLIR